MERPSLFYRLDALLLVKPMTFMNECGRAVRGVLSRHNISPSDAMILFDDLDLPLGRMRILGAGGSGSHNGMRSVLGALGTEAIPRLRVGIEQEERGQTGRDYVLDRFSPDEWKVVVPVLERAVEAIEVFRRADIQEVMTRFNRRT